MAQLDLHGHYFYYSMGKSHALLSLEAEECWVKVIQQPSNAVSASSRRSGPGPHQGTR